MVGYTLVDNWIDIGNNEDYLKVKDKNDGEVFNEDLVINVLCPKRTRRSLEWRK